MYIDHWRSGRPPLALAALLIVAGAGADATAEGTIAPAVPAEAASSSTAAVGEVEVLVVTARLLATDPAAAPGETGYLVEVDEVRHGTPPAGVLAVRLVRGDLHGHQLVARTLAEDGRVELTLSAEDDGSHRALAVRATGGDEEPGVLLPPRPTERAAPHAHETALRGDLRRRTAAATAEAPFEHQVLELVNEERLADGNRPPLKGNALLDDSAGGHSFNMADRDFFAHCDPDTDLGFGDRILAAGYVYNIAAENIAAGSTTPENVMALWMSSPGHSGNILSTTFRELGVGYFAQAGDQGNVRRDFNEDCTPDSFDDGPFVRYWTQNFGRRDAVYPLIIEREAWAAASTQVDLYTYGAGDFTEMRFSNDNVTWSNWMPFSSDAQWTLDPGPDGVATVWAQLGNGGGPLHTASDTIEICVDDAEHDLSAQTVTTSESWEACYTITAGDGFHVAATGDVTFTARRIVLGDGFSVAVGGTFRAVNW